MIKFFVAGIPKAQKRPRFFRRGSGVGCYDPSDSRAWKDQVVLCCRAHSCGVIQGAVRLTVEVQVPRPKSLSKKVIHCIKRPDLDNYIKGLADGISDSGVIWVDDSCVTELIARKKYGDPGVWVTIEAIA